MVGSPQTQFEAYAIQGYQLQEPHGFAMANLLFVIADQTRGIENFSLHDEPRVVSGAAMASIQRTRRQHLETPRNDDRMTMLQEIGAPLRGDPVQAQQHR